MNNELLKSITRYLPADFDFYDYSIIGEVKNRDTRKFSKDRVIEFEKKFAGVKKLEKIDRAVKMIGGLKPES